MPIPIPAIPSPAILYKRKSSPGLAMIPKLIIVNGPTNKVSIKTDLAIMLLLAYLLIPLVLKYWLTRIFNVFEKSDPALFVNFGFSILFNLTFKAFVRTRLVKSVRPL
jgi:hypothetical protein